MAGGGFGRRFVEHAATIVVEACEIAKAARAAGLNAPVRTLWSREDDIGAATTARCTCTAPASASTSAARCWPGTTSSSASPSPTGTRVRAVPGQERHRRHGDRGHARSLPAADAPDRASPQAQRAGAVVAQRGLHPHRLRDGDLARRDRPHHEAGPGGLPHAAVRRQAPAPPRRAAAGGGQERLRQEAAARRPRLGRGGARVLRLRRGLCGGSLGAGRPARCCTA